MADHLTAEIYIGGKIKRELVPSLCEAICAQELGLDWMSEPFEPQTEEELLEGLDEFWDGPALHFYDAQSKFGEFFELEEFLRLHNLPYSRQSGGSYCYDAGGVDFRPGRDLIELGTSTEGTPVITHVREVERALELVKKAQQSLGRGKGALDPLNKAADLRARALPELPALEPIEIVP
jgi:hypothetical protein